MSDSEEPNIVRICQEKSYYSSEKVDEYYHIGTEEKETFCNREMEGLVAKTIYTTPNLHEICPTCIKNGLHPSIALAKLAKSLEKIMAYLREDAQSLLDHHNIPKAIAGISRATNHLMEEARHRALEEQMGASI